MYRQIEGSLWNEVCKKKVILGLNLLKLTIQIGKKAKCANERNKYVLAEPKLLCKKTVLERNTIQSVWWTNVKRYE